MPASHSPSIPVLASFRTVIIVCHTGCLALAATPLDTDVINCDICWKFARSRGPELSANWRKVHEPGDFAAMKEFAAQIVMASEMLSSPKEEVRSCSRLVPSKKEREVWTPQVPRRGNVESRTYTHQVVTVMIPRVTPSRVEAVFSSRWHSSAHLSAVRM